MRGVHVSVCKVRERQSGIERKTSINLRQILGKSLKSKSLRKTLY